VIDRIFIILMIMKVSVKNLVRSLITVTILTMCLFTSTILWAVLPPEEEKKWHEGFLLQVNVKADITFNTIAKERRFGGGPVCRAYYTVNNILQQPDVLNLMVGDTIVLSYPCDEGGQWNWMGSTLPWAQADNKGGFHLQLPAKYLIADGRKRWQVRNDPPVFAPVKPGPVAASVRTAEDVVSLEQIDVINGIDRDEANVIAKEFFHRYISACGMLGDSVEKESAFEYPAYFGKKEILYKHPLIIDKTSGKVSMEEFSTPLDAEDIESEPPLGEIMKGCETSGEEDILAWEYWLQREKKAMLYCPPTDYYVLNLEEEDYPPEVRTLAPHQRYDYCKYGNPATIFAVFTDDKAAKAEACADEQLVQVRAGKAYDLQEIPVEEVPDAPPLRRFKLVSPHFAAAVYTTVYDIDKYDFWVDRSYELLRYAERAAVDCLYLDEAPSTTTETAVINSIYTIKELKDLTSEPGATYEAQGFIVDIYECPPCPPDAVCATCPGEYITISDSPHKGTTEEEESKELLVSTMMFGGSQELSKWAKFHFTLKAAGSMMPSWSQSSWDLIELQPLK